jgi:tetratricopeptide (TPR) repeat protein
MRTVVEELFCQVADLSPEERLRYFAEQEVGAEIRGQVEALLAFDSDSVNGLDIAISQVAQRAVARFDLRGSRCGHYVLDSLLGRGGMGSVYAAHRVDGEVCQRVAVKLLRPEAGAAELHRRFLAEREILAALSHRNIARLLDAGHREDGQPYLVMEHVAGKPVDEYAASLALRQKIALFLNVCSAVSYLHRNLVVHRDLKPSNILVNEEGEPKLLDFGIAKMLDLASDPTLTAMRMLTPSYASPEQFTGGAITTATDIYSLGAVLYKLLTGSCPRVSSGAPIPPPSQFAPELKGDLEMIVMKALRPEPQERYASVDALADDLRAHLECRPVQARSGERVYRARRFLARHWISAVASAAVVASLSLGLYLANHQRRIAEHRFEQLQKLSTRVLDLDVAIRDLPNSAEARRKLVAVSLQYLEGLSRDARGNLDLTSEIAQGYIRLAQIEGVNVEANLGDSAKAEEYLKRAEVLIDSVLAARPHDLVALYRAAMIDVDRMVDAYAESRRDDVVVHARHAVERLEALLPLEYAGHYSKEHVRQVQSAVAGRYVNIAVNFVNVGKYAEGALYSRRAADIAEAGGDSDVGRQSWSVQANALRYQGDLDGALDAIRRARKLAEQVTYSSANARLYNLYGPLMREGVILGEVDTVNLGRPDEAIPVLQSALDMAEEMARRDPKDNSSRIRLGTAAWALGDILRDREPGHALAVYDLGIRRLRETWNNPQAHRDSAVLLASSSYSLRRLHRVAEAKVRIEAALAALRDVKDYPAERVRLDGHADAVLSALADYEADVGSPQRALEIYRELLRKIAAWPPAPETNLQDATALSRIYREMARVARHAGRADLAGDFLSHRRDLWKHWDARLPNNSFVRRQLTATDD